MFRTERRRNEKTGVGYPWLVRSTGHGEPSLHPHGPRLWTVLPQVQQLLSLQRQALPERVPNMQNDNWCARTSDSKPWTTEYCIAMTEAATSHL